MYPSSCTLDLIPLAMVPLMWNSDPRCGALDVVSLDVVTLEAVSLDVVFIHVVPYTLVP